MYVGPLDYLDRRIKGLEEETNINIYDDPGYDYNNASGGNPAPPATATPTPNGPPPVPNPNTAPPPPGAPAGSAGSGGPVYGSADGGNISQGNIYGGTVTNTASGGTYGGTSSGGSGNTYDNSTTTYNEGGTTPAASPTTTPGCGGGPPCQPGQFCKMGVCEPIPEGEGDVGDMQYFHPGNPGISQIPQPPSDYWANGTLPPPRTEDKYSGGTALWNNMGEVQCPAGHYKDPSTGRCVINRNSSYY